jgi:hypothetical protein
MTHDQIVAALRRGYQLDDARESRRGTYPIRNPAPRAPVGLMRDDPPPFGTSDPTGSATAASSEAMTGRGQTHGEQAAHAIVAPVDTVDHARGDPLGPVIVEYGDYECPYARVAFREIERVQRRTGECGPFRLQAFSADRNPPACPGSRCRGGGGGAPGSILDHARAALPSPERPCGRLPAAVCRQARPRCRAVRSRPERTRRARACPARRAERLGDRTGDGHTDPLHRWSRAPWQLQGGRPAGGACSPAAGVLSAGKCT